MMVMTTRKPEISVQALCSVAVIMCSFGFSLSRCHSLIVANSTRKAIRYPSTASALAVSWKLANLKTGHERTEPCSNNLLNKKGGDGDGGKETQQKRTESILV